jgi:bifunctional NMN adenylyltransferase/nudix hydrolase
MSQNEFADVAVLIGRFQPFHNGHAMLLKKALESAQRVIVVLGSAFHARSAKNPFTWQERAAMIAASLPSSEAQRISFTPMRDYYEDARWAAAVQREVKRLAPDAKRIRLVGHFKDASSYYLNLFPQWDLQAADIEIVIDSTRIRRILFEAEDIDVSLTALNELMPNAIRQYLKAWARLAHFEQIALEHKAIEAYRKSWASAPYPPIFTTVDAVVKTAGHVLLIKRKAHPGKDLWALPGGFLEPRERLLQGAVRELCEETKLGVLTSSLFDALVDVKVFDHPDRSQRGRTITHAHFFELGIEHLPSIEGSDDAAMASWIPVEELDSMENQFFDDHFHILNHFLRITVD